VAKEKRTVILEPQSENTRRRAVTTIEIIPRKTIIKCKGCGWYWRPNSSNPTCCPHCHTKDFDGGTRIKGSTKLLRKLKDRFILAGA